MTGKLVKKYSKMKPVRMLWSSLAGFFFEPYLLFLKIFYSVAGIIKVRIEY